MGTKTATHRKTHRHYQRGNLPSLLSLLYPSSLSLSYSSSSSAPYQYSSVDPPPLPPSFPDPRPLLAFPPPSVAQSPSISPGLLSPSHCDPHHPLHDRP